MSADYAALRLKAKGDRARLDEILNMECRDKTRSKLARTLQAAPDFRFPSLAVAEMATSDAMADIHAGLAGEGGRVADMTFGLGIDAFAFARRASSVTAFDIVEANVEAGRANSRQLGLDNVTIECADSVEWLRTHPEATFDTIFIDPARRDGTGRHFRIADCLPNLTRCVDLLLERCGRLIVKLSPMLDITASLNELGLTDSLKRQVDVVVTGLHNECKELLLVIPGKLNGGVEENGKIRAVTVGRESFDFRPTDVPHSAPRYAEPEAGDVLLEPYPAVMKAGAISRLFDFEGVAALHPNTHLFTAKEKPTDFPAKVFRIVEVLDFSSSLCKTFARTYPQINVAARNFPLRAPELAKKLKVREGGEMQVFGVTACDGKRLLVVTKPV